MNSRELVRAHLEDFFKSPIYGHASWPNDKVALFTNDWVIATGREAKPLSRITLLIRDENNVLLTKEQMRQNLQALLDQGVKPQSNGGFPSMVVKL